MTLGKILAGTLIFVASLLLGKSVAEGYECKKKFLIEFLHFIEFVQGEIDFYNREFNEIIASYANKKGKSKFVETLTEKRNPEGNEKLLVEYVSEMKKFDKNTQKNFSKEMVNRIKTELADSEKEDKQKAWLVKRIVPLCGIAIFILLL